MRIAIVSGDDIVGDDPQQLSAALTARGHEVTRFVRHNGRRAAGTSADGRTVSVGAGPRAAKSVPDVLPYVGDWAAALAGQWAAEPPDVVHAYGWLGGLAAQLAARRQAVPTVQTFLGLAAPNRADAAGGAPQEEGERLRIEPLLARSATWVTGESSDDVEALSRLRRGRARVSALTSGVDVERFNSSGPAPARTDLQRVLCLAPNPLPHNGFDIAIDALRRVPATELVVAETAATNRAHDDARARLHHLAARLGVDDRVRFAGTVAGDELPMLLRSADVVACTPRRPPRATAVLQAMASGVVVAAFRAGVLKDAVVDNVTGLLVSPESSVGLSAALRSILPQSFQCESMGAAGRSRAVSRYAWDRIALDALNIYRQVAALRWTPARLQSSGVR
ncbi:glycosyltransferase [Mycobacterium europaeum]|uniref:glycosyltransferase n=1 Tax=Mycobacterium europaeum TaxID=761804 RepID=UPI002ADF75D9|nr:glycosyltransferase [Mycobacterium europaeum]MEA1160128.1 glycosyltransferase [Mycobacterium europaeum]